MKKLVKLGAALFLCTGRAKQGSYHPKEIVVDRRALYTGSSNHTLAGREYNREACYIMTGAPVAEALADFASCRQLGKKWAAD